jgi:hypothetical protein
VKELGQFPSCTPVPAVVKENFKERKLFGQADKGLGDQHERSPRIFHRKVLFMEQAEFNKIASDLM